MTADRGALTAPTHLHRLPDTVPFELLAACAQHVQARSSSRLRAAPLARSHLRAMFPTVPFYRFNWRDASLTYALEQGESTPPRVASAPTTLAPGTGRSCRHARAAGAYTIVCESLYSRMFCAVAFAPRSTLVLFSHGLPKRRRARGRRRTVAAARSPKGRAVFRQTSCVRARK